MTDFRHGEHELVESYIDGELILKVITELPNYSEKYAEIGFSVDDFGFFFSNYIDDRLPFKIHIEGAPENSEPLPTVFFWTTGWKHIICYYLKYPLSIVGNIFGFNWIPKIFIKKVYIIQRQIDGRVIIKCQNGTAEIMRLAVRYFGWRSISTPFYAVKNKGLFSVQSFYSFFGFIFSTLTAIFIILQITHFSLLTKPRTTNIYYECPAPENIINK